MAEARYYLGLILFHVLLFRKFYFQNPYCYARSEPLDFEFPAVRLLGESLRQGRLVEDPYFLPHFHAHPILSSWYPPHLLLAWISSFLTVNVAFLLCSAVMVLHCLGSSCAAYWLLRHAGFTPLVSFFNGMILSSLAYVMKQNSCIVYTLSWIPILCLAGLMQQPILFGISLGMMLLAGYWPIALPAIPLACYFWVLHLVF